MTTVWLVGCGNMAGAMLTRWLDTGMDPTRITVIDPHTTRTDVRVMRAIPDEAPPTAVMLGVKPQILAEIVERLQPATAGVLLLSILAGIPIATLRHHFPAVRGVARIMPNLPVAIGKGAVALHMVAAAADHMLVTDLLAPLGLVERIGDETLFDAVTALSGSGPAFVYRFIDALTRGGQAMGLAADQAERLALATVEGAAMTAATSTMSPADLADRVASKGGSTRKALDKLDDDDALVRLVTAALRAAEQHNRTMATLTTLD